MADEARALPDAPGNPFSGMSVLQEHAPAQGQRVSEYLGENIDRPWEQVAPDVQRYFGVEPSAELQETHRRLGRRREQDIQIAQAREAASREPEPLLHAEFRRLPGFRTGQALGEDYRYNQAVQRFQGYQATPEDMAAIARYEHWRRLEGQESFGERLLTTPAMAAEMLTGGRVAQAAAPLLSQGAGAGAAIARGAAQIGIGTAAMPEMWAPEWTRANTQAGRDTFDPKGLGKPLLNAYIQTAVLHSLGAMGGEGGLAGALESRLGLSGTGIGKLAGQTATRSALGTLEQEAADAVSGATGLHAGYGPLTELAGDLLNGEHGHVNEHLQRAAMNAITFAVAGSLHNANAEATLRPIAETLGLLHERGVAPAQAGQGVDRAVESLAERLHQAHNGPQDLTREEARDIAEKMPSGPYRDMLLKVADAFPKVQIPRIIHSEPFTAEEAGRARPPEGPERPPGLEPAPQAAEEPQTRRWRDTGTAIGPGGEFQGRDGRTYRIGEGEYEPGRKEAGVKPVQVTDEGGKKVGEVQFVPSENGETHFGTGLNVDPEHRKNGVGEAMYDMFQRQVGPVEPSKAQTAGTKEQAGKGGGKGFWERNKAHAEAEDTVQRHLEDIHRVAPDVSLALFDTLRANPHLMPEMAKALESPEFKKEVRDVAATSARSRGWSEASIRRAFGERLPESVKPGEAPTASEGGEGGGPPTAPQGPTEAAGDTAQRGAGGPPTAPVGGAAGRDLVSVAREAIKAGKVVDLDEFKSMKLDELKDALKELGIAGRPVSKADALRRIKQVMETQAEMAAKVKQIQGEIPPGLLQEAAKIWQRGDKAFYDDLEAIVGENNPDHWAELKKVLGPFEEKVRAQNKGLAGINAQGRADVDREPFRSHIEDLYHGHEVAKTAAEHGPEAAAALRQGLQDGLADGESAAGEAAEGEPLTPEQLAHWQQQFDAIRAEHPEPAPTIDRESFPKPESGGKPDGVSDGTWNIVKNFAKDEGGFLDPQKIRDFAIDQAEKLKGKLTYLGDQLRRFAGTKLPALTRLSRESGEAAATFDTAPERARIAAPHFTDVMMGKPDSTPQERQFIGTTFNAWRLEHMREAFGAEATRLFLAAQKAGKNDPKVQMYLDLRNSVTNLLGTPGYAADKAALQRDINSPAFREFAARWAGKGGFAEIMERNFKTYRGMDPNDVIDSLTQIPGFPINLKSLDRPEGTPGVARGNLANTRLRKLPFDIEATGSSEAYETDIGKIIEHSLARSETLAAKANMVRTMVDEDVAQWGREGLRIEGHTQIPNVKPPAGTQEARQGQTSLYVKNEAGPEIRQLLQVDQPWSRIPGTGILTGINLAGFTDAAFHTLNNLTMLAKPGVYPWRVAANAWKVMRGDPQVMDRILELSRMGIDFQQRHGGLFGGGKFDPTSYAGKFLETMHRTMALTMDDAFTTLAKRGDVVDDATNRRDFVNQLGNYSKRTQNAIVAFLRDTGLGPTSTAGTNYTMQALRSLALQPGAQAASTAGAVRMRAAMLARGLGLLASVGIANYLQWGRLDGDDNTPLGALKVGEHGGKSQYLDIFGYTPWGRGLRATGAASIIEGQRAGAPIGQSVDRAAERVFGTLTHPFLGAPFQFGYEIATGKNPATGERLARDESRTPRRGQEDERSGSQQWENLKAALWNINPAVATLTGHQHAPTGKEREMDWSRLLGPFGPKERSTPIGAPPRFRTITVPVQGYRSLRRQ